MWLFARARSGETQRAMQHHLQRNLDIQRELQASPAPLGMPLPNHPLNLGANTGSNTKATSMASRWEQLADWLCVEAWGISPRVLGAIAAGGVALALFAAVSAGIAMGLLLLMVLALLFWFAMAMRVSRRRTKMLAQLPAFLDNVVRLISIGNSPHAAFQFACNNVPEPLGGAGACQRIAQCLARPGPGHGAARTHLGLARVRSAGRHVPHEHTLRRPRRPGAGARVGLHPRPPIGRAQASMRYRPRCGCRPGFWRYCRLL